MSLEDPQTLTPMKRSRGHSVENSATTYAHRVELMGLTDQVGSSGHTMVEMSSERCRLRVLIWRMRLKRKAM